MLDVLFTETPIWVLGPAFFILLAVAAELGFRLQRWLDRRSPGREHKGGSGQILGVALGLMSLLLSFTFSLAINRYDTRRALVLEEANAIGTAWQQADILPEPFRASLVEPLRDYTGVRIAFFEAGNDQSKLADVERRTGVLQVRLWAATSRVVDAHPNRNQSAALMNAMNHAFDLAPARKIALAARIPTAVLASLSVLLLASAVMLGAVLGGNGRRHALLSSLLLVLLASTITLIIDIDRPRQHHVRVNQAPLLDLRLAMLLTGNEH